SAAESLPASIGRFRLFFASMGPRLISRGISPPANSPVVKDLRQPLRAASARTLAQTGLEDYHTRNSFSQLGFVPASEPRLGSTTPPLASPHAILPHRVSNPG
ncbi:MAG TPA: hypothetical protein VND92_10205, partial [Vicinamibacterales bacterium]|nr:hypothetical protein [Vicinamibacterales bacterium]